MNNVGLEQQSQIRFVKFTQIQYYTSQPRELFPVGDW
jgi:hypothetical protein